MLAPEKTSPAPLVSTALMGERLLIQLLVVAEPQSSFAPHGDGDFPGPEIQQTSGCFDVGLVRVKLTI